MRRYFFYVVVFTFLFGVFVRSATFISIDFIVFLIFLGTVGLIAFSLLGRNKHIGVLISLSFIIFSFGVLRFHIDSVHTGDPILNELVGEIITLRGFIVEDPDERQTNTKLTVLTNEISFNEEIFEIKSKVLITIEPHYFFHYGDSIETIGKLKKPESFVTDTGREFNYVKYLAKDNIFYIVSPSSITQIVGKKGNIVKRSMLSLKGVFVNNVNRFFPQPEGALLAGVLFGEKAGLGQKMQNDFRKTGVIHIVVLSGFNVTIVALFIIWILRRFLSQKIAFTFGVVGIILFAILVGGGATVVRASIMAIFAIIARLFGRENEVTRAMLFAGFLMVLQNPQILMFDISFQLSFLATFGVVFVSPSIEKRLGWITESFTIRETVVGTFAAQVFVLPLLLYAIGEFSIVAPIANVLVVPWVPITMLLGFISALLGVVWSGLGVALMVPNYFILHIQIKIVEWFASLSFSTVMIPQFPVWVVFVAYIMLGCIFLRKKSTIVENNDHGKRK